MRFIRFIIFISISGFTLYSNAQVHHQIGLNGTQFIKQFIVPNNVGVSGLNPYLLQYRNMRKKLNYRAGLGGNYSFTNEDNQSSRYQRNTDAWSYSARLGIDFTKAITKHWFFYYGADLTTTRSYTKVVTNPLSGGSFVSKSIFTRKAYSWGGAGTITFEYRFNSSITLFTEANLLFSRGRSNDKNENPDFPNSTFDTKLRTGQLNFSSPVNIFFSIIL